MKKFYYGPDGKGKLIRDKLDSVIRGQGHTLGMRRLSTDKIVQAILNKFPEEIDEIAVAVKSGEHREMVEELADLKSLTNSLQQKLNISQDEVDAAERAKSAKKGAFVEGLFVEYVELNPEADDYDFWLKYYRDNSDRYVEHD